MSKILTQAQAKAVYDAMCALNNVGATIKASFGSVHTDGVNVFESLGEIHVALVQKYDVVDSEIYAGQSAFAAAYSLGP